MTKFTKIALAATFAFAFAFTAKAATVTVPPNLMQGSMGQEVMDMQSILGITADGNFGPMTKASVMAFQSANGLTADGVVGPMTAAKLNAVGAPVTPTPTPGDEDTNDNNDNNDNGALEGGAGDINLTSTSSDVESSVKENEEEVKIFGVKAEADGSDIEITSVKVTFSNCEGDMVTCALAATSSENFEKYVDSVQVMLGDEVVGEADADEFSKDTGTPDTFDKTISLDGAVIREDDEEKLYVAVTAVSSIDSADFAAEWDITLNTMRFIDATGAILSADVSGFDTALDNDTFTFEDANTDDDISIKSSTSDPDATTLLVKENAESDDYMIGAFKFDVDNDSSDITVNEFTITVTVNDSANTGTSDDAEDILSNVWVEIDGDEYEGDLDTESITNGDGAANYIIDTDGDLTIDAGDDVTVEVFANFNDQDGNYGVNTTVVASATGGNVDAEGADDLTATGSFGGETHTLSLTEASIDAEVDESTNDDDSVGYISFTVEVDASDSEEDFTFDVANNAAVDGTTDDVRFDLTGTNTGIAAATLTKVSGDASYAGGTWTVVAGETATFALDITFTTTAAPDNGTYRTELTTFGGETIDLLSGPINLSF